MTEPKVLIVYHHDLDGEAAAAVAYQTLRADFLHDLKPECLAVLHGKGFRVPDVGDAQEGGLWILDFSIEPEAFAILAARGWKITWIDHHATAIKAWEEWCANHEGAERLVKGMRSTEEAACTLTWTYCEGIKQASATEYVTRPTPRVLKLIGDADQWKWEYGLESAEVRAGLTIENTEPASALWQSLLWGPDADTAAALAGVRRHGLAIHAFRVKYAREMASAMAVEASFESYRCLVLNTPGNAYSFGEDPSEPADTRVSPRDEYDLLIAYTCVGVRWSISLYSSRVNCGELAARFGGGGHAGAAGFIADGVGLVPGPGPSMRPVFIVQQAGEIRGQPLILPASAQGARRKGPPRKGPRIQLP